MLLDATCGNKQVGLLKNDGPRGPPLENQDERMTWHPQGMPECSTRIECKPPCDFGSTAEK